MIRCLCFSAEAAGCRCPSDSVGGRGETRGRLFVSHDSLHGECHGLVGRTVAHGDLLEEGSRLLGRETHRKEHLLAGLYGLAVVCDLRAVARRVGLYPPRRACPSRSWLRRAPRGSRRAGARPDRPSRRRTAALRRHPFRGSPYRPSPPARRGWQWPKPETRPLRHDRRRAATTAAKSNVCRSWPSVFGNIFPVVGEHILQS